MSYPSQNNYHLCKGSPIQGQQMNLSSINFVQNQQKQTLLQQQRLQKSNLEEQLRQKVSTNNQTKRLNSQKQSPTAEKVNSFFIIMQKVRESSEQRQNFKVDMIMVQNKSQLIYGSSNFNFMNFQTKQVKLSNTISSFKEMNIKISDMPPQTIIEDPQEIFLHANITRSKSPSKQMDSNKEWSEILTKTKNLEENLLQLKNSINKNLTKIQRYKNDPKLINDSKIFNEQKTKIMSLENSGLLSDQQKPTSSPQDSYFRQYLNSKQQDILEEQNRLSKESTQSKYSTQSKSTKNNILAGMMVIIPIVSKQTISLPSDELKNDQLSPKSHSTQIKPLIPVSFKISEQVNGAYTHHGMSHNPSMSSLSLNQKMPNMDCIVELQKSQAPHHNNAQSNFQQGKDVKPIMQNLTRVQTISRIQSPLQSKLGIKDISQIQATKQDLRSSKEAKSFAQSEQKVIVSKPRSQIKGVTNAIKIHQSRTKIFDPLYLPLSPLKDRLVTGQFIGRGKFSDVFLAKDTFTGFHFALKVIRKEIIAEFQMEDQISREIKIQSQLDHPNIVKLYGTFYDDEKIYLAIEYCSDGELFQHQHKQPDRKFDEIKASQLIGQILEGINYMHDRGVMHRDLKTENILLSYNQIKLCDLGCVCDITTDIKLRTTFCGTVDYIAPEVITGGGQEYDKSLKGYDQRCDIWQIGVLAYELVVGRTPFTDQGPRNEDRIMNNILKKEVKLPDQYSKELRSFVTQALQKDPEKRISVKQMLLHPWVCMYKANQNLDINTLLNR